MLFWLELLDEEDSADAENLVSPEEQPKIPLHAIVGVSTLQNMLLEGKLGDFQIQAMVNSEYSFVCEWTGD